MKKYVVGFLFSEDKKKLVLIRKLRPVFHKGKLNGPGGKIEDGEMAYQAMEREFEEEAGIRINTWKKFCTLRGTGKNHKDVYNTGFYIHFFKAFGDVNLAQTKTDEQIEIHDLDTLDYSQTVSTIKWLIPLALDENITIAKIEGF